MLSVAHTPEPPAVVSHPSQIPCFWPDTPLSADLFAIRPPHLARALFLNPKGYRASYKSNAHAQVGAVRKKKARQQHETLVDTYEKIGIPTHVLGPQKKFPDAVFTANQTFPFLNADGDPVAVLSKMFNPERRGEEGIFRRFLKKQGYDVITPPRHVDYFEGMGDALWMPGRNVILGGFGIRTSYDVYPWLAQLTGAQIFAFELRDEYFYHLDTCLCPLDSKTALVHLPAFTQEGREILRALIPDLIDVPVHEAQQGFACNAHCPDGENVIIQAGNIITKAALESRGFIVHEVHTQEFMKAGGSVFCLKMMIPT